jgi:hypothetical protein
MNNALKRERGLSAYPIARYPTQNERRICDCSLGAGWSSIHRASAGNSSYPFREMELRLKRRYVRFWLENSHSKFCKIRFARQ